MKTKFLIVPLVILCLLFSSGCMWQKTIVGKWQSPTGSETMEFFRDGTVTAQGGSTPVTGKYTILDEKRVKIELGGMASLAGPIIATYEISGNELTMTAPSGDVSKYRRAD